MNKYEREVARSQLESERKVLEELEKIYSQAAADITKRLEITNGKIEILLSEIDKADEKTMSVLQSQIYQRDFQKNIKKQLDFILESLNDNQYPKIYDYLKNSYDNGFIGTLYSLNMSRIPVNIPIDPVLVARAIHIESKLSKKLYESLGEDVEILKKRVTNSISRGIASGMHYSEIALNIANNSKSGVNNAMRIVRTEGGRIYSNAAIECGKAAKEKTGADLIKQWDSTLDGLTREHHRQLDGQVRELEEDFEVCSIKAPAPLHFGIPGEDINCRCISLIKPRWDVDEAFTKRDNASGELLEFEGTKDYEDFKSRYWKSVDKSEKGNVKKLSDNTFIPAKSIEEAEAYAKSIGVRHVDYSDLPVETANLLNEAVLTIPKEIRPAFLGSGNNIQKYSGAKFSRASKNYYGVKVEVTDMHFGEYPNIVYDFDGGHMVGISNYYKTADKITKSKLAGNKKYAEKYNGHTQFFNTDGRSTAFHEMGHVYADKIGIPQGFSDDVKRWYDECNCDMLKSVDEAWAEAWGAYHIQNKELPDYIAKYIEKATEKPLDKVNESGIMKLREISSRNLPNGLRTAPNHILTEEEILSLKKNIQEIGADESVFKFNIGRRTGYDDVLDEIRVKGDVLPDENSNHPRDKMSARAALAHEYYGHRANRGTQLANGAWNDEFRASYMAAKNCPNLTDEDRYYLIADALERAKEAGVTIKYNDFIRRILYGY